MIFMTFIIRLVLSKWIIHSSEKKLIFLKHTPNFDATDLTFATRWHWPQVPDLRFIMSSYMHVHCNWIIHQPKSNVLLSQYPTCNELR